MAPKIGISTKLFSHSKWPKELHTTQYKVLELNRRSNLTFFDDEWIAETKHLLEGFDLSMHSACRRIFLADPVFSLAEQAVIKAEILMCNKMGIKELIFHLKQGKLDEKERGILDYAKSLNVTPIYESNATMDAEVTLSILEHFPDLDYNLDLGHLNHGIGHGKVKDVDAFLKAIDGRIVYIHAHNNGGQVDEHKALTDGTLDWRDVLDKVDLKSVKKIILELKRVEDVEKSRAELDDYLKKRKK
jgi:sugar phosphate isomerase/epimerase